MISTSERSGFRWDDDEQVENVYAHKNFWIGAVIGAVSSLYGASQASKAGEEASELMMEGGALSKDASYANAADAEALGSLNAGAITKAASNNATMYREIGYANANAIARATTHNLAMYQMQSEEQIKLHAREEKWHAGEIRAMGGGSGFSVNSGSPLSYLRSEITKGIEERFFMERRDNWTMLGHVQDGLTESLLTVKSANYNAKVTESNAALKAQVTMAEAIAQAAAMRRQGDISAQVGVANAQAARAQGSAAAIAGIGNAAGSLGNAYSSWKGSQTSYSAGNGSFSGSNWQAGYAGPR